jgi:uncharacterized protein
MPLIVNLRHLEKDNLDYQGDIPPQELELEGIDDCIQPAEALKYSVEAQLLEGNLYVHGALEITLQCTCVRCLKIFQQKIELPEWSLLLNGSGEDPMKVVNDCVDLTPYIREDIVLSFPQHPLCEKGCHGLPNSRIGSLNQSNGPDRNEQSQSAWAELDKLKLSK